MNNMESEILIFSYVWKMKYCHSMNWKQVAMKFIHVVEKKIKIMLLDSLNLLSKIRGRKASIPTYFLYEELSHREKQPSFKK